MLHLFIFVCLNASLSVRYFLFVFVFARTYFCLSSLADVKLEIAGTSLMTVLIEKLLKQVLKDMHFLCMRSFV